MIVEGLVGKGGGKGGEGGGEKAKWVPHKEGTLRGGQGKLRGSR